MTGDGIPVPVPKGFTASSVESERYVNHNEYGALSSLTFMPGEKTWEHDESDTDKAWVLNNNNVWVSQNYHVPNSEAELVSNEFTIGEDGGHLSIEWSVSSNFQHNGYGIVQEDILSISITNTDEGNSEIVCSSSGTDFGTYMKYNEELEAGTYVVTIKYTKDQYVDSGSDRGYVKSGTIINYNSEGTDSVPVHRYGGFVIYEGDGEVNEINAWDQSKTRNQFVWVPVEDSTRVFETNSTSGKKKARLWNFTTTGRTTVSNIDKDTRREPGVPTNNYYTNTKWLSTTGFQGYERVLFYKELQNEFDRTMESIEKYGGFYIGRYETGNINSQIPVVRRLNEIISNQTWYNMYFKMKNISSNENIQTNMIWGCLFDEVLQWIIDTREKNETEIAVSSKKWGNYVGEEFSYIKVNEVEATKNKVDSSIIPTGSAERTKTNNIYDLAGNVSEWTLENEVRQIHRGGSYQNTQPAAKRYEGISNPYDSYRNVRLSSISVH